MTSKTVGHEMKYLNNDSFPPGDYFKTGNRLDAALANIERIDGMEDMLDSFFFDRYEIQPEGVSEAPHYIDECPVSYRWNGDRLPVMRDRWDRQTAVCLTAETVEEIRLLVQYVPGIFEPYQYGQVLEIDGESYIYIGSELLPEEQEHQADDGSLSYEYRGYSLLRILVPLRDEYIPDTVFDYLTALEDSK